MSRQVPRCARCSCRRQHGGARRSPGNTGGDHPNTTVAPPVSAAVSPAPVLPGASPASPESTGGNLRTVGLVTAGLGVVGLAVGTVYGITAIGKKSDAGCSSEKVCPNQDAANTFRDATSAGTTSTIFFAAGTVLTAVGVTLYFVAPKERASARSRSRPASRWERPG